MEAKQRDAFGVAEARERIGGISQVKFYELINSGRIRTFRIGRRRLVSQEAITEFIQRAEAEAVE